MANQHPFTKKLCILPVPVRPGIGLAVMLLAALTLSAVLPWMTQAKPTFTGNAPASFTAPEAIKAANGTGACCFDYGEGEYGCFDDGSEADCISKGGSYQGDGTVCGENTCEPGACCMATGACVENTEALCVEGTYQGAGTDCDPNPCLVPTGACCLGASGGYACTELTASECYQNNPEGDHYFQGAGSTCDSVNCMPISVTKTADPTTVRPGSDVTFTVRVFHREVGQGEDPFGQGNVKIDSLMDDVYGDLDGQGDCVASTTNCQILAPGESYTCQFTAAVNGSPGDVKTDTVTASGRDVISDCTSTGNNDVSAQGSATVTVVAGSDYGDAEHPINNRYPTLLANTGASHVLGSSVYLGACVDGEDDGQPTTDADGDDTNVGSPVFGTCGGNDDEDGVTFTTLLVPGATADVDVTAHAACTLSAWIDFNLDGDWADPGEELFPGGQALTAGANSLSFSVPSDALIGTTYARFRCTTDGAVEPNGQASDGEVEDYLVTIETISDLGDAPDPKYPTLLASTGARHGLGSDVYLGACVDAEDNGQPTAGADGDDTNVGSPVFGTCVGDDDEDGVTFTTCLRIGAGANVDVLAHAACTLSAWIDFNGDGDWLDAGEDLFPSGQALAGGVNGLSFAVPADAVASTTYARFRCTTDGKVPFTGRASDGEVEDYQVIVKDPTLCPADLDGNCWVNTADLSILISQWGECQGCSADLNDNGWVNTADLSILLSQWGECP